MAHGSAFSIFSCDNELASENGSMWPLSLNAGERGDALHTTWSTPLTQHIAPFSLNSARAIKISIIQFPVTCPLDFAATAAPSTGFSTAASSFPAVLAICAPMLLVQQRNPTGEMNEQRPQASFPKFTSQTSFSNRSRGVCPKPKWPQREVWEFAKCGKGEIEMRILSIFFVEQSL